MMGNALLSEVYWIIMGMLQVKMVCCQVREMSFNTGKDVESWAADISGGLWLVVLV